MKKGVIGIVIIFLIIFSRIIKLNIFEKDKYNMLLSAKTEKYVYGITAQRGKILDRNGIVLVDNIGIKTLYYNVNSSISKNQEIDIAYQLANIIEIDNANELNQKKFYLIKNNPQNLLTLEEEIKYKNREITKEDLTNIKYSRINLDEFNIIDKKAAQIYYLMNNNYLYAKKEIKKSISEDELAQIMELNIPGITCEVIWERNYPYKDLLRSIFGSVGKITKENKKEYIDLGYQLSDTVGLSFLEYQYDKYLKGDKALYKVEGGNLILVKSEKKGRDIYLNIDINIEMYLNELIKKEILIAKTKLNTEYFSDIFAIIGNPTTGNIIAISGLRYNNGVFSDITSNIISSSFTMGSVVKGATIAIGFNNNLIEPNKYINDSCVKLYLVPQKCSFKRLGKINDVSALANSSNYYQYLIAIGLTGNKYYPNIKINASQKEFEIYRNTLATYGLGNYTEIDLPGEKKGIQGNIIADDLLLNLAIGQYDTYTSIGILQYINTVATGTRNKLNILNRIEDNGELIYKKGVTKLNDLEITEDNLNRVRLGLQEVIRVGTGKSAANIKIKPAGKTGTSESFYDTNNDGKTDAKTISTSLAIYFPYDNPKYSIAIVAPNISHENDKKSYTYSITKHISSDISNFLFENY